MLSEDLNRDFIQKSTRLLAFIGIFTLCAHLISLAITGNILSIFALPLWGTANINNIYPAINFSITAIAIAYCLSLFSRMGWFVAIFLLLLQAFLFAMLLSYLLIDLYKMDMYADLGQIGISPLIESVSLNICLLILALASILYLFLPEVRAIFWEENKPPTPPLT